MAVITGAILRSMGKQLLKNLAKKTVKATAKKAVKAVVKKKKVKGKDVAKKMFGGGEESGGAIVASPGGSLVSAPGGGLAPATQQKGGELVVTKSNVAKELGLSPFMDSLTSIQTNVDAIKAALNDNNKDTKDRIDDQRLLNAKLKKEEREAALEGKKPKKGKGILSGAKDVAEGFLTKMARFATMTLLGSLIASLMGGARDVILAFRIGIEALKKGLPTLFKGVKALKSGIGKAFSLVLRPFKSLGNLVLKGFKAIGSKLFGMVKWAKGLVDDAIKGIVRAGAKAFPKAAQMVTKTTKAAGTLINQGKNFVKNTARNAVVKGKRFIGRGARKFLKGGGSKILKHGMKRGANRLIIKWFGKGAAKTLATVGKTLVKGAKAIKIPVIGPLLVAITSMFSGDPIGKTLFKTAGAAIGGGLGLALGPIGMIVGEIAGEFIGDVLHEGFMGKDGWAGAGKKLKDKFMQIVKGGKVVLDWIGGGFSRFFKGFMEEHSFELPWWVSGPIKKLTGLEIGKLPNILQLYNPMAMGPLLLKSFFPPGGEKEKSGDTQAKIGQKEMKDDAKNVSSSASYEDGGEEEPTIVMGGGGDQATAPSSQAGQVKFIPLDTSDSSEVLNKLTNATLYKV